MKRQHTSTGTCINTCRGFFIFALLLAVAIPGKGQTTRYLDSLKTLANTSADRERLRLFNEISESSRSILPEDAVKYGYQALRLAQGIRDKAGEAVALKNIGEGFRNQGDNKNAMEFFKRSLQIALAQDLKKLSAQLFNGIGIVYRFTGDLDASLDYHLKALALFEYLKDDHGRALSLNYSGVIYRNLGNYGQAFSNFQRGLAIAFKNNYLADVASIRTSLGNYYWYRGQYDSALSNYESGLKIKEKLEIRDDADGLLNNIGNVYRSLGNNPKAMEYYEEAMKLTTAKGDKNLICTILKNIGITYKNAGNYPMAMENFHKSIQMARQIDLKRLIIENLQQLTEIYEKNGNYKLALESNKYYSQLRDSVFSGESQNKIAELQVKYESERKQKIINELELEKQKSLRNYLIICSILAILFSMVMIQRYMFRRKSALVVAQKKDELESLNKQLQQEIVSHKIDEAALALKTEENQATLEAIPDLLFKINKDGYYTDFHATRAESLAMPPDAIIGTHFSATFPEEISNEIRNSIRRCLETGDIQIVDYTLVLEGRMRYFEARIVQVNEEEVLALCRETTERRVAEEALAGSENLYRAIFNNTGTSSIIVEDNATISLCNTEAAQLLGYSREEIEGKRSWVDFVYPEDREKMLNYHKRRRENAEGVPSKYEFRLVTREGEIRETLMNVTIIPGTRRSIASMIDITDLRRAEAVKEAAYRISEAAHSVKSLEELYRLIHAIVGELMPARNFYITLFDETGSYLTFPYFIDDKDPVPSAKLPGKGLTEYVIRTGEPLLANPDVFRELVRKGEVESIGSDSIDWLGVPLKIGEKTMGVVVVQTYAEGVRFKEYDKEILTFVSEQIAMSIDRKRNEAELLKARDKAEESSRLKSNFLKNMSHELRTPMTGILGFAEILKSEVNHPHAQKMAENILTSGNRLMTTLNSIMELSQLESGPDEVEFRNIDLGRIVLSVANKYEETARKKNLFLKTSVQQALYARLDEGLLTNVLTNLIDNAIKFTSQGGVTIEVKKVTINNAELAEVKVTDTGIGIPENYKDTIFHEFRQVSEGLSRSYEGSGLGLTLAKRMTEAMNGTIGLVSEAGIGSAFFVRFPLCSEGLPPSPGEGQPGSRSHIGAGAASKDLKRVLIVEDNLINTHLVLAQLEGVCLCDHAPDGDAAIKMAAGTTYDAIFLDINLGLGINGLEVARKIRSTPGMKNIPIVAITGYALPGDKKWLLEGGCSHYLAKPYTRDQLVSLVREIFEPSG